MRQKVWEEGCDWWLVEIREQGDWQGDRTFIPKEANRPPNPEGEGAGFVSSTWVKEEHLKWDDASPLKKKSNDLIMEALFFPSSSLGPYKPPRFLEPQMLLKLSPHHCYQEKFQEDRAVGPSVILLGWNRGPGFCEAGVHDHNPVQFCGEVL